MPAHCSMAAIGHPLLSNGKALSKINLQSNSQVDILARGAAKRWTPRVCEDRMIVDTSGMVEDVARWIGQVMVLANHFPFSQVDGTTVIIRDSEARKCKPKLANGSLALPAAVCKRKPGPASPDSVTSLLSTPRFQARGCTYMQTWQGCEASRLFSSGGSAGVEPMRKRSCITRSKFLCRENTTFYSLASVEGPQGSVCCSQLCCRSP